MMATPPIPRADFTLPPEVSTDVILLDIIQYTTLPNARQYEALYYLNRIIGTVTGLLDMRPMLQGERVLMGAVPAGDGCFLILNPRVAGYGPLLALFMRNFLLFNNRHLNQLFKGVRSSVHHGPILPIDFLGTKNYAGEGLNVCARLQGPGIERRTPRFYEGDDNYVIVSAQAWERFRALLPPSRVAAKAYLRKIQFRASRPFAVKDKHQHLPNHHGRFIDCGRVLGVAPPRPTSLADT